MSRVPIRLRVTLAFTLSMALVLAAVGLFVYLRLEAELEGSVDRGAHSPAQEALEAEREESFDDALDNLVTLLLIGGPAALLLASLAGYATAGAALRPVEAMRRRAAEISAAEPRERLPVPAAEDELRRLGETLNEMLARIEATLERERRFVDDASHELRTPLALQRTELELALRQGRSEAELRAAIASALEEVDRLSRLAEGLLVVARNGQEGLPIERDRVAIADVLTAIGRRFGPHAAENGRRLRVDADTNLVVDVDRARLEQALSNLVDNALQHGEGEVRVRASAGAGTVRLRVSDRGAGFPAEFLPHAFERLSRADVARGRGGAGLGLSIVETIARAHGGRARAANNPTGGAEVWIELPAATV